MLMSCAYLFLIYVEGCEKNKSRKRFLMQMYKREKIYKSVSWIKSLILLIKFRNVFFPCAFKKTKHSVSLILQIWIHSPAIVTDSSPNNFRNFFQILAQSKKKNHLDPNVQINTHTLQNVSHILLCGLFSKQMHETRSSQIVSRMHPVRNCSHVMDLRSSSRMDEATAAAGVAASGAAGQESQHCCWVQKHDALSGSVRQQ
jgi:hypothetical protein